MNNYMRKFDDDVLKNKHHIHMIGIGGSGMYPLAQILNAKGYHITGSDNNETDTLRAVRAMGIEVFLGQRAENINGADLIIHTAAIMQDNPELIERMIDEGHIIGNHSYRHYTMDEVSLDEAAEIISNGTIVDEA